MNFEFFMKPTTQKIILRRLKIIEGQIRGLQRLTQENIYCIDLLRQFLAVKHALSTLEDLILKHHLATCALKQIKKGKAQKAIEEIVAVYKLSKQK